MPPPPIPPSASRQAEGEDHAGLHPAVPPFKAALVADGIPFTSFMVDSVDGAHARLLALGVSFTQAPVDAGPVRMAVLDDTCGNLIQIVERKAEA